MEEVDVREIDEVDRVWALKSVDALSAWEYTKGEGIRIAILDSGASLDHPDLKDNIVHHKDFTNSRRGAEDINGHGSHVAGLIAAKRDGKGIVGISPEAKLYIAKVLKDNGQGSFDAIIEAIEWAIAHKVDIIVMSLGAKREAPEYLHYIIKKAYRRGILMIAAAGNKNKGISYPAAYEEVVAVSAVNKNLEKASFSNYGIENEIAAPGVDILSTYKNKGYAILSGTSMAAPLVAGASALYISHYRGLVGDNPSPQQCRDFLSLSVSCPLQKRNEDYGQGLLSLQDFDNTTRRTIYPIN